MRWEKAVRVLRGLGMKTKDPMDAQALGMARRFLEEAGVSSSLAARLERGHRAKIAVVEHEAAAVKESAALAGIAGVARRHPGTEIETECLVAINTLQKDVREEERAALRIPATWPKRQRSAGRMMVKVQNSRI